MYRILPAIHSPGQHLRHLQSSPEDYRPQRCPHCGKAGVWLHGHYLRKADREGSAEGYLDPVPIPRFYCAHCRSTCSRLPACIAPRRWYSWGIQQAVLVLLLAGNSLRRVSRRQQASRRTLGRWWAWLQAHFTQHAFHLRSRFPELGRHTSLRAFWSACFRRWSLAAAMALLDQDGVPVP
jgi:transposase-like protein